MRLLKIKLLFFCLLLNAVHLIAQSHNSLEAGDWRLEEKQAGSASGTLSQITTSDYCEFLNERAADDSNHFYDGKMRADVLEASSILRSGVVGNYRYEVIPGKENLPMTFLSYNDVVQYCAWKNSATSTFNFNCCVSSCDPDLKSNILTFCLASTAGSSCQAAGEEAVVMDGDIECFFEVLAGLFVVEEISAKPEEPQESRLDVDDPNSRVLIPKVDSEKKSESVAFIQERLVNFTKQTLEQESYQSADLLWMEREAAWQDHKKFIRS